MPGFKLLGDGQRWDGVKPGNSRADPTSLPYSHFHHIPRMERTKQSQEPENHRLGYTAPCVCLVVIGRDGIAWNWEVALRQEPCCFLGSNCKVFSREKEGIPLGAFKKQV